MFPPSAWIVVVPLARSLDLAIFGYGIGTGPGDGVLQTSGMVAIDTPVLALWHSVRLLILTVTAIAFYPASVRYRSAPRELEQRGAAFAAFRAAPEERVRAVRVSLHTRNGRKRHRQRQRGGRHISPAV